MLPRLVRRVADFHFGRGYTAVSDATFPLVYGYPDTRLPGSTPYWEEGLGHHFISFHNHYYCVMLCYGAPPTIRDRSLCDQLVARGCTAGA